MNEQWEQIGARIALLRTERGFTQAHLAEHLDVEKSAISRIERGQRGLAASELRLLCELLDVSADEVLFPEREVEGALFRSATPETAAAVERASAALADLRYLRALVGP